MSDLTNHARPMHERALERPAMNETRGGLVAGWDIGGAHVKACVLRDGVVVDVAQWACPLWQGMAHLAQALGAARERWPMLDEARHAVTMTGEMVDLFPSREDGVKGIVALLAQTFGERLRVYAGDEGWYAAEQSGSHWAEIASANWLATAQHAAERIGSGALIDIGSTTTDLIVFRDGRVLTQERSDAERLASGALVYQGVVRTPLCALAQRIPFRGRHYNVMNEFFATTADVHRLAGELNPNHDLHPSADQAPKTAAATQQRLARMIGLDARDAGPAEWLQFAEAWREAQLEELAGQLDRVLAAHELPPDAPLVGAGCGDFLAARLGRLSSAASGRAFYPYYACALGNGARDDLADRVQVCAPSVAIAMLFDRAEECF